MALPSPVESLCGQVFAHSYILQIVVPFLNHQQLLQLQLQAILIIVAPGHYVSA
jgi:hypothetical protein